MVVVSSSSDDDGGEEESSDDDSGDKESSETQSVSTCVSYQTRKIKFGAAGKSVVVIMQGAAAGAAGPCGLLAVANKVS